jgi:hypothetical protein
MGGGSLEEAVSDASIPLVRPAILKSNNNQHLMQQVRGRAIVAIMVYQYSLQYVANIKAS